MTRDECAPALRFDVFEATDTAWPALLCRVPHDVYHLPGYARLSAAQDRVKVRLGVASNGNERLVMPFILREIPGSAERGDAVGDITVPYGYPGPVCSSGDVGIQRALVEKLLGGLGEMGAVSAFVRCHPFLGVDLDALRPFGDVVIRGQQVYLDLPTVPSDPADSFRRDHRYNIRSLQADGFTVRIDHGPDQGLFPDLYRENMRRVGADPYYLFGDEYFAAIRAELSAHTHIVTTVSPDGEAAALAILFVCEGIAQYHLSATDACYLKRAPIKLAIHGMMILAREMGVRILNLGGGVGGRADSLFEFKAGFSRARAPFATAGIILDSERYAALSADSRAPEGFFPAYRAPQVGDAGREEQQ